MNVDEAALFLNGSPLFAILDRPTRLKIAQAANERSFPKGTLIFNEGDPGEAFYVLVTGRVKVFVTRCYAPRVPADEASARTLLTCGIGGR